MISYKVSRFHQRHRVSLQTKQGRLHHGNRLLFSALCHQTLFGATQRGRRVHSRREERHPSHHHRVRAYTIPRPRYRNISRADCHLDWCAIGPECTRKGGRYRRLYYWIGDGQRVKPSRIQSQFNSPPSKLAGSPSLPIHEPRRIWIPRARSSSWSRRPSRISTCISSVCRQMLLLRVELAATGSGFVFILGPNAAETSAKGILALV